MKQSCDTCKFWYAEHAVKFKKPDGVVSPCKRYPPKPFLEHYSAPVETPSVVASKLTPMTKGVDWCGEYVMFFNQITFEKFQKAGFKNMAEIFRDFPDETLKRNVDLRTSDVEILNEVVGNINDLKARMKSWS